MRISIKVLKFCHFHKLLYQYVKMSKAITVLSLHRVNDYENPFWPALKIENFKKLLQYVVKHYSVIDFSEMESKTAKPKLVLTFDDGYHDFMENVLPLLQKAKLPCNMNIVTNCVENTELIWTQRLNHIFNFLKERNQTFSFSLPEEAVDIDFSKQRLFYVKNKIQTQLYNYPIATIRKILADAENALPGYVPGKDKMMSWEDVIYCSNNGVRIGSHTISHGSLKNIVDEGTLHNELFLSRQIIESRINKQVDTIAFPNGQYNDKVIEASFRAGYKYLLLVDDRLFHYHPNGSEEALVIPRLLIHHNDTYSNMLIASGIKHFR